MSEHVISEAHPDDIDRRIVVFSARELIPMANAKRGEGVIYKEPSSIEIGL